MSEAQTPPINQIQQLIDAFEAGYIHARRLSDGVLIDRKNLGDFITAIVTEDVVIGSRSKFEQARAEFAAQVESETPDRPFSRILIPSAEVAQ